MGRTGIYDLHDGFIPDDDCPQEKPKQTNADRIRAMSDEELADELLEWFACFMAVEWSRDMILNWLKKEVTT